jgi:hypothetical protein
MNMTKDETRHLATAFTGPLCLFSRTVHAAPDAPRDPEVEPMAGLLRQSAISARDTRLAIAVTQLTGGVAFLPADIILSARKDPVSQSIGIGAAVDGGVPLLFSVLSLLPSKMEGLSDHFEERRASNMAAADLVRVTEGEWREAANASHNVACSPATSRSASAARAPRSVSVYCSRSRASGLDRNGRYAVGSLPWKTYRATSQRKCTALSLTAPSVLLAPLPSGAMAVATFAL